MRSKMEKVGRLMYENCYDTNYCMTFSQVLEYGNSTQIK